MILEGETGLPDPWAGRGDASGYMRLDFLFWGVRVGGRAFDTGVCDNWRADKFPGPRELRAGAEGKSFLQTWEK